MRRVRIRGLGVKLGAVALVAVAGAFGLWATLAAAGAAPTSRDIVDGKTPVGEELAAELGIVEGPSSGCGFFVETVESGEKGYCLEGLGTSDSNRYVIGLALREVDVSQEQLETIEATIAQAAEVPRE